LELELNPDQPSVGGVESSRKDRDDVEGDGWIASKNRLKGCDVF
jgi:hypothetical protein